MKVYIAIRFWTPNQLGGLGSLTDCEVFLTEKEAVEYVRNNSEGKEPEKNEMRNPELYSLSYATKWESDEIRWYIVEKEVLS